MVDSYEHASSTKTLNVLRICVMNGQKNTTVKKHIGRWIYAWPNNLKYTLARAYLGRSYKIKQSPQVTK
jgi:hypothetical protein